MTGGEKYIQREISWVAFNRRVLDEALRTELPLLERLKFLAIVGGNFDEFFMVRVARLMRDADAGDESFPPVGERPSKILADLLREVREVVAIQYTCLTDQVLPGLAEKGLRIVLPDRWDPDHQGRSGEILEAELFPLATPLAVPEEGSLRHLITDRAITAAFRLDNGRIAFIRLPDNLPRFRLLRTEGDISDYALLDDILLDGGDRFFPGREIESRCLFRLTRDADMTVDEERDEDFIAAMAEVIESRKSSFPVRLETIGDVSLSDDIRTRLELDEAHHFALSGPLDLRSFFGLVVIPGYEKLRHPPTVPQPAEDLPEDSDLWETLRQGDVLLHHPYESFAPVVRMVSEAADDPATLAIKMTLYRTSGDSPIVHSLIRAAERGVQVTVLVELKARFDEGANIAWASRLSQAGAIVVYGLAILKVHAKALMVVRREDGAIRRYLHLGTGNYNDTTARLYTDMGLMTCREKFTRDAALFFNAVTGYSVEPKLDTLVMAPFALRRETLRHIRRETKRAKGGEEARIVAKLNSLVDPEIIEALYEASAAGVMVDLNVRGICCLRPGVKGLSDNIRVVSVIDGYLEHTRAFVYHNGGSPKVYFSSADWMARNLDRRVELLFPITEAQHKRRVREALDAYFRDNQRARELLPDGAWRTVEPTSGDRPFRAQEHFTAAAQRRGKERDDAEKRALKVRRDPPKASSR